MKALYSIMHTAMLLTLVSGAAGCMKLTSGNGTDAPEAGKVPIVFPAPIVSPVTKADTESSRTEYPTDESFGIYGIWYKDSYDASAWDSEWKFIDGAEFSYDRSLNGWISNPAYAWMPTGKSAFAAWSPYSVKNDGNLCTAFSYGSTGLSINGFSSGKRGTCDLMYGERVYDKTSSNGSGSSTYNGIDLVFHHALAALRFTSNIPINDEESGSGSGVRVSIFKITLWGFSSCGNFDENAGESTDAGGRTAYASSPEWSGISSPYTEDSPLTLTGNSLFIIPQTIPDEAKIEIQYSVAIGSAAAVPSTATFSLKGNKVSGTDEILSSWEMGHRYTYNINITSIEKINFTVSVKPWYGDTDEGSDIKD